LFELGEGREKYPAFGGKPTHGTGDNSGRRPKTSSWAEMNRPQNRWWPTNRKEGENRAPKESASSFQRYHVYFCGGKADAQLYEEDVEADGWRGGRSLAIPRAPGPQDGPRRLDTQGKVVFFTKTLNEHFAEIEC